MSPLNFKRNFAAHSKNFTLNVAIMELVYLSKKIMCVAEMKWSFVYQINIV